MFFVVTAQANVFRFIDLGPLAGYIPWPFFIRLPECRLFPRKSADGNETLMNESFFEA